MKYVFLLGNHKSGTSLLRSLLDSHEHGFAIPIETHLFKHLGLPITYALNRSHAENTFNKEVVIQNFYKWIELNNRQKNSNFGGNYGFDKFDEEKLKKYLESNFDSLSTLKDFIEIYLQGIFVSSKIKNHSKIDFLIEKSVENFEYAETLHNLFPNSKFIHITRNPYSNIVSLRNYHKIIFNGKVRYKKILEGFEQSFYYLHRNKVILGNDYYHLKYEDLVEYPEPIMKKLATFLEIDFKETMLTPTVLGEKWKGNSASSEIYKDINASSLKRINEINTLEIALINRQWKSILCEYKKTIKLNGANNFRLFFPYSYESLKEFIKNRILLFE